MNNLDLKELIFKIAESQDKGSFNRIFDYFSPRIMGYLVNSGTNRAISEEITQEVLSTVWQKAYQFDQKVANVSTWIFTIARNKKIDRLRKNKSSLYNNLELIDALYPEVDEKTSLVENKINKIQSKLNKNEQKLIRMNFFEGKTHKIMSRDLEIPLGTVKSRIRNILLKMRKL
jgi:RNA polymerase sigma-70 factor (ECF subfamily)